jgi:hypothetical protein
MREEDGDGDGDGDENEGLDKDKKVVVVVTETPNRCEKCKPDGRNCTNTYTELLVCTCTWSVIRPEYPFHQSSRSREREKEGSLTEYRLPPAPPVRVLRTPPPAPS